MTDASGMFDPLPPTFGLNGRADPSAETSLQWVPVIPEDAREAPPLRGSERWWYRNASGRRSSAVDRYEARGKDDRKVFVPVTLWQTEAGEYKWLNKNPPAPRPIYGCDRLAQRKDSLVLVVEGEKAADAAAKLFPDLVVVTSSGGAQAAGQTEWGPVAEREVVIWPDNDNPGRRYAADVAKIAHDAGAASVRIVNVPGEWPPSWDLADTPPAGVTVEALRELIAAAAGSRQPLPPMDCNGSWPMSDPARPTMHGSGMETSDATAEIATTPDVENELLRLSALTEIAYETQRVAAAGQLGLRVTVLDREIANRRLPKLTALARHDGILTEVEPWSVSVDGAEVLFEMVTMLCRFMMLPKHAAVTVALWVMFAHTHEVAANSPILAVESPEKRCGKTTLLSIVADFVPVPLPAANISPAALFRSVEKFRPTMLIDEGDSFLRDNEDMRGILNSGFTRASAVVIRCDGEQNDPTPFSTWCPKLIALIGKLPDTLQDRSIVVTLRRKLANENVERLSRNHRPALHELRAKCARWALDHLTGLMHADPAMPKGLNDRGEDAWRPLLAIADAVGGEWPDLARQAAVGLSAVGRKDDDQASAGVMLLAHIRVVFEGKREIGSTQLAEVLNANEEWPWGEWRQGKPISPRGVARMLARYEIKPKRTNAHNVYLKEHFADAWNRYLAHPGQWTPSASSISSTDGENESQNNGLRNRSAQTASSTEQYEWNLRKPHQTPVNTGLVELVEHSGEVPTGRGVAKDRMNGHGSGDAELGEAP